MFSKYHRYKIVDKDSFVVSKDFSDKNVYLKKSFYYPLTDSDCYTLAWEPSGLYRGDMEWEEKEAPEGRVLFTCPEEGLDYLLYAADRDGDIHLEDYGYLCLEPEVLEEHSMCFQLSFYENRQEPPKKGTHEGEEQTAEPDMRIIFGLLPGIRTLVPFDLSLIHI